MSKLFISASSKDDSFVKQIVSAVESMGHETFYYKKDIRTSDTWPMREAKGLDWADYIICFVSDSFLSSRFCTDEMAVGYAKDNLITVKIESCKLPGQFAARNYLLDVSSELSRREVAKAIKRFSNALEAFFNGTFDSFDKTPPQLFHNKEIGVVFASFKQVSGTKLTPADDWLVSIRKKFTNDVKKSSIKTVGVDKVITSEDEAALYLARTGAAMIIWGSVSALNRLEINFTTHDRFSWALPKETYAQGIHNPKQIDAVLGFVSLKSFRALLSDGSDVDYVITVLIGMAQHLKGKFKDAFQSFTQALKIVPAKREQMLRVDSLHYLQGMVCAELSRFEEAIKHLGISIKLHSGDLNSYSYYNRGVLYYSIGDYYEGIADFTKVIELDSTLAIGAYEGRATCYAALGDHYDALTDYTIAADLDSQNSRVLYNRSLSHYALGNYLDVIVDCTEALSLRPDFPLAYINRGMAKVQLGQNTEAIDDFSEVIKLEPKQSLGYYLRGTVYSEVEAASKNAIADFTSAIKLNPKDAMSYYSRGMEYGVLRETAKSIADFTSAIKLEPEFSAAYYWRGSSYQVLNMWRAAFSDINKYISLSGDNRPEIVSQLYDISSNL